MALLTVEKREDTMIVIEMDNKFLQKRTNEPKEASLVAREARFVSKARTIRVSVMNGFYERISHTDVPESIGGFSSRVSE